MLKTLAATMHTHSDTNHEMHEATQSADGWGEDEGQIYEVREQCQALNDGDKTAPDRDWMPGYGIPTSLQVCRTLRRRKLDYKRKYEEQLVRGRPGRSWRQCNDPACSRTQCLYADIPYLPVAQVAYRNGRSVARRTRLFLDAMVRHLWGDLGRQGRRDKWELVDSFVWSPPVRGAMGLFNVLQKERRWRVTPDRVARKLAGIRDAVMLLVSTTRLGTPVIPDAHVFFGGEYPRSWSLSELTMQFCVLAETWRRYGLERGADWDFGSDEAVADLHCAVLVNFVSMCRSGAVLVGRHGPLRLKETWEIWLDRWHPMKRVVGKGEVEEDGSLEGLGRGASPWRSARMREATDGV